MSDVPPVSASVANASVATPQAAGVPIAEERLRLGLLLSVGVIFMVWLLVGILQHPSVFTTTANSHNTSPAGHHALRRLLEESGAFTVRESTTAIHEGPSRGADNSPFEARETLVFLEPDVKNAKEMKSDINKIFDPHESMPDLVLVLPKWDLIPTGRDEVSGEILLQEFLLPVDEVGRILYFFGLEDDLGIQRASGSPELFMREHEITARPWAGEKSPLVQHFYLRENSFEHLDVDVLMESSGGYPVAIKLREKEFDGGGQWADAHADGGRPGGTAIIVSDPDIFCNARIGREGVGDAVMALFHSAETGRFVVDERLHGLVRTASLEYLAATPPGLWPTLALMLMLGIFGWQQSVVRVMPRASGGGGRGEGSRIETITALGRLMRRARDHDAARLALAKRAKSMLSRAGRTGVPGIVDGNALAPGAAGWESARDAESQFIAEAQSIARHGRQGRQPHGTLG